MDKAPDWARCAGGRRHFNAIRREHALMRRKQVVEMLILGMTQAEIARELDVHPATICRDVRALFEAAELRVCPRCGRVIRDH